MKSLTRATRTPDVMGGSIVAEGWVIVHSIAGLLALGHTVGEVLEGYPRQQGVVSTKAHSLEAFEPQTEGV